MDANGSFVLCAEVFSIATREIISDDALLSQVLQSATLQTLKLQGMRPSSER